LFKSETRSAASDQKARFRAAGGWAASRIKDLHAKIGELTVERDPGSGQAPLTAAQGPGPLFRSRD